MMKKLMLWKTKGMNRDLSVSAFNPEFAFENINLRLSTNEGNTLMSWVNERGTERLNLYSEDQNGAVNTASETSINGTVVGTAILNHQLILFSAFTNVDFIYRLRYLDEAKTQMACKVLYAGNLSLYADHPLETLVSYESEAVQKVYWVDGKNQPRVINIAANNYGRVNTCFDFIRELRLEETVTVQKQLGATGMFAPGVIQYAFTYFDKYAQESNIFYVTPLYYISNADRGVSPEGKVENAFKITVNKIDKNFEFLRIYSIQRTSLNATPVCKRIQDIAIKDLSGTSVSYTDNGFSGNTVDPTELLFKNNQEVTAETLEQKDGTLFLGGITLISQMKETELDSLIGYTGITNIRDITRSFQATAVSSGNYQYANQLTSVSSGKTVPCGGFKSGDYYRLGVQFQYKTGRWSKPIFVEDHQVSRNIKPSSSGNTISVPVISGMVAPNIAQQLMKAGYKKVRAVVVFPEMQDRVTICQGVINPTLYTSEQRNIDRNLYAQSSWFFRPNTGVSVNTSKGTVAPSYSGSLPYAQRSLTWSPINIRTIEVQGDFDSNNRFTIDNGCVTFHSPDIEFDDTISVLDFEGLRPLQVGDAKINSTLSDIDIQTETPTVSNSGAGFVHKSFTDAGMKGIVSGLFYDDFILDDWSDRIGKDESEQSPFKWMVYLWNKSGSLNNDFNRPTDKGTQTAKLKKKVISNLRFATTSYNRNIPMTFSERPQLFSSDEVTILKLSSDVIYQGNIDTSLVPDHSDGMYFCHDSDNWTAKNINTSFCNTSKNQWWKTFSTSEEQSENHGIYKWQTNKWESKEVHFGDHYMDLVTRKEAVRMKYKSSPHLVFRGASAIWATDSLPIVDIVRKDIDPNTLFGGTSRDAFRENTWIPCGEPKLLTSGGTTFLWEYGDTYFQRWDCLKTYAFTREDLNQVVEIGSFMLETHVNIDGRYDRNRGQLNNLNMSPMNFNLHNPVYSQIDNFFSYKIMDDESYKNVAYPNQITWSKTKSSDTDIDLWTNLTLASVLELDGDKGKVNKLIRYNDQLLCFQDTGISQVLYNENTQISTTEGVPVEITNSGKVQGKRYLSNTIGCSNKWSVVLAPAGVYFMDSNDKSIYLFNGHLTNLSQQGMNAWSKATIPSQEKKWNPFGFEAFVSYYDRINQDVLFINSDFALAWSERFTAFTSFYDYGHTPYLCCLDDTGIWVKDNGKLWKHQAGEYCQFFGVNKPYSMILVGNPEPQTDKIFTNIEFRANVEDEGVVVKVGNDTFDATFDGTFHPSGSGEYFKFCLPFDSLEVWNEYQHGIVRLNQKNGHGKALHTHSDFSAHLDRKFRMWRCDVPRNNYPLPITNEEKEQEKQRGIFRKIRKTNDRMRNSWLYLKLKKDAEDSNHRTEIHDITMAYFGQVLS